MFALVASGYVLYKVRGEEGKVRGGVGGLPWKGEVHGAVELDVGVIEWGGRGEVLPW